MNDLSPDDTTDNADSLGIYIYDDTHPRASIVHVFGEATFAERAAFEAAIDGAAAGKRPVVINLRECSYIDCAAVGVIVRTAKNLRDDLRLALQSGTQGYRILELTGLTRVLQIFETVEEAAGPIAEPLPPPQLRVV